MLRKDFTPSERVDIGKAVEAEIGNRHGGDRKSEDFQVANLPLENEGKKTRDVAAEKSGFSSTTQYRQAKTVTEKGTEELVEAMDTGKVSINEARYRLKRTENHLRLFLN